MLLPENYKLVQCAKSKGCRVVVSTIINLCDGYKIDFCKKIINKFPILTNYKMNDEILSTADAVVAETEAEKQFIANHYGVECSKIFVIPNGVDECITAGDEIYNAIGKKCSYVLMVGRFDPNKNQLNVIRAMKDTDIDIVFIGGADFSTQNYYEKCLTEASGYENIHLLGWVNNGSPLLRSAYQHAETVVVPSFHETFGFTLLEGGTYGAKIVASKNLPILSYKSFNDCITFNPRKIEDIRNAIIESVSLPKDDKMRKMLMSEFSWKSVLNAHIKLYQQLIQE